MTSKPVSGQISTLIQPNITDTTLSNGLRVVFIEKHNTALVSITVAYRVGSRDEKAGKTGMAHLFEHLMFEGSPNLAAGEYDRWCTLAGGVNNAYTQHDFTVYYCTMPASQLQLGLWLESDRMLGISIAEEELRNQQDVVLEEINENVQNQPYGNFPALMAKLAFSPDAPYGHDIYGSPADIDNVTLKDVQEFFETYYRPDNAVLTLAGNIRPETAMPYVEKYFGGIPIPARPLPPRREILPAHRTTGSLAVSDNIPFDGIFLAFHLPGAKEIRSVLLAEIMASVLSDGMSSRLRRSLQYEAQLVSEVGAYLDEREEASLFTLYASARDTSIKADTLEKSVLAQLRLLATDGITTAEIAKAKNKLATRFAAYFDKASNLGDEAARYTLLYGSPKPLFEVLNMIESITVAEVQHFAKTHLNTQNMSKVVYLPR